MFEIIDVRYTRCLLLRAFCVVYLTAFLSFYIQKPGLYGDNGVMPAKAALENSKYKTFPDKLHYQPNLLWLASYVGLDINYALDVLALSGAFLAFTGFVSQTFCTFFVFIGLWSLYFSMTQVGQVFVTNGFDELLLEAGFLAILTAPVHSVHTSRRNLPGDQINFWMMRWLLFRLLVTNGLTKLLSGGPAWWSLTALAGYFETTPLPTPLAWYAHHLPEWFLKLSLVYANVCELGLPFLFFVPVRSVRLTGFFFQVFLQLGILLTGNFGFSNVLVVTLLLSLLDDDFFFKTTYPREWSFGTKYRLGPVLNIVLHSVLVYFVVQLFSLELKNGQIDSKIAFTKSQLDAIIPQTLLYTHYAALATLVCTLLTSYINALYRRFKEEIIITIVPVLYCTVAALFLFNSSTVPLKSLHPAANSTTVPHFRTVYNTFHNFNILNQYVPVNKIPETSGRSEIIFEGAKDVAGPWQEVNFLFKPGNVNSTLPFCAPHSPRLDWQMSVAAHSTYDQQPWLISFAHRILTSEPDVLSLIDFRDSAFRQAPPKYLRAVLYNYRFTPWSKRNQNAWWTRQRISEYMPAFTKDSEFVIEFLKARNLLPTPSTFKVNPLWKQVLDTVRYVINHLEATLLYWSVLTAGFAIICTSTSSKYRMRPTYHRMRHKNT